MKLLTYEVSDCSLALTTLNNDHGYWNCTLVLSHEYPDKTDQISVSQRQFLCDDDSEDAVLELALQYTTSYIDTFFPEFSDDDTQSPG